MLVKGEFKLMGCVSRPSFNDPSRINYILGLSQGLDTLRVYIDAAQYAEFCKYDPYSDVVAELNYNPLADKAAYSMRLVSLNLL